MGIFTRRKSHSKGLPPPGSLCSACQSGLASLYDSDLCLARSKGLAIPFTSKPWRDASSCRVCSLLVTQNGSNLAQLGSMMSQKSKEYRFLWVCKSYDRANNRAEVQVQAEKVSRENRLPPQLEWASQPMLAVNNPTQGALAQVEYLAGSTASTTTMATISDWINQCDQNHAHCRQLTIRKPEDRYWRPKRLLDIGSLEEYQVIGLNERSRCQETVTYATLSYSWGRESNLKLERNVTYDRWQRSGIPWGDIPQVIKEAIQVVKSLHIRFLWVDASCLMQGAEWQQEATEMAKTYSLAYVNIVADKASGCRKSMIDNRDPRSILFSGAYVRPSRTRASITQPSRTTDVWLGPADPWESISTQSYTKSRAWIMQEELLAQRRIHFAKDQVFWECTSLSACEIFPKGAGAQGQSIDVLSREFAGLRLGFANTKRSFQKPNLFETLWATMIEEYTSRQCSNQSDRLLAVAGIAEVFGELPEARQKQNQYLAGLWYTRLEWFLCWYITSTSLYREHTDDYIAPSWSWASTVGSIRMDILGKIPKGDNWTTEMIAPTKSLIEPVDAMMRRQEGISQYHKVTSGSLRLRGHLFMVQYENASRKHEYDEVVELLVGSDRDPTATNKPYRCWPDRAGAWLNGIVYFLPILEQDHIHNEQDQKQRTVKGILVKRTRNPGEFYRVAFMSVRRELTHVPAFVLPGKKQPQLGSTDVLSSYGNSYYKFDLV